MKYNSSIDRAPYRSEERYTPAGTPVQNVGAILLLSFGVVVIVLLLGLLICVAMDWPLRVVPCGAGVALLVLWVVLLVMYREWPRLFYTLERVTEHDINHDGVIGQPQPVTHFELPTGPRGLKIGQIDVPPPVLISWCRSAIEGHSLAYNAWIARFSLPDGTGGRERYAAFRHWLCEQGYAREVGGNVGLAIEWDNDEALDFVFGMARALPEDGRPLLEGE
jgi:hypothetical protein